MAYRPPKNIGRALADRQIQPFDERRVQFRTVLGVAQHPFQPPRVANQSSSLDLDDTVVPTRLDHLAVQTRWPKDANDSFFCKCESVRHDERDTFEIHSTGYILQEDEGVSVALPPYDGRGPEPRPEANPGKDPHRMFFVSDDRLKLVCLNLHDGEFSCFVMNSAILATIEFAENAKTCPLIEFVDFRKRFVVARAKDRAVLEKILGIASFLG